MHLAGLRGTAHGLASLSWLLCSPGMPSRRTRPLRLDNFPLVVLKTPSTFHSVRLCMQECR